jgi:hypothetical protein
VTSATTKPLTNEAIGQWGEHTSAAWFHKHGYRVSFPKSQNNAGYDFIVEKSGVMQRVQVKASAYYRMGRPEVCIVGGGKVLDTNGFDLLFTVHMCGKARLYPASDAPKRSVSFGGVAPKPHKHDIVL